MRVLRARSRPDIPRFANPIGESAEIREAIVKLFKNAKLRDGVGTLNFSRMLCYAMELAHFDWFHLLTNAGTVSVNRAGIRDRQPLSRF
jgi:hypothetical protein